MSLDCLTCNQEELAAPALEEAWVSKAISNAIFDTSTERTDSEPLYAYQESSSEKPVMSAAWDKPLIQ